MHDCSHYADDVLCYGYYFDDIFLMICGDDNPYHSYSLLPYFFHQKSSKFALDVDGDVPDDYGDVADYHGIHFSQYNQRMEGNDRRMGRVLGCHYYYRTGRLV